MAEKKETIDRFYPLERTRNIGIIAHIDAGKTTTTERILFDTGRTYKHGSVDEGTTVTDWMVQERERGITITAAAVTCFWTPTYFPDRDVKENRFRINIIDTPGHVDFTAEVERALRVLDGAIMVFDGKTGVEAQSETVWRQADKYRVPRVCFINKLNLIGGDFQMSIDSICDRLHQKAFPIWLPIGSEYDLKGAVDLVEGKAFTYENVESNELTVGDIPENMKEEIKHWQDQLLEVVAEHDDAVLSRYLENEPIAPHDLKRAIRKATLAGEFFPVTGGDARTCIVHKLVDAVVDYLPSPLDLPPIKGVNPTTQKEEERPADEREPFSALAFKVQTDPHMGRLIYLRIYSGRLEAGSPTYNATKDRRERAGRLFFMHADKREQIKEASAGEIVATVGLSDTTTGDSLCDPNRPILFENIAFPDPVISLAIEPRTKQDQERLSQSLGRLAEEDPTFKIKSDPETGQTIISGMGELHLEILVDRLKREFNVAANTGNPQVAYRETIKKVARGEGKYIRQTGGRGQYGHCLVRVEPLSRGEGFVFESEVVGGAIPREFIPAIEKGAKEALDRGVLAGFPMTDIKVAVYDGTYHEVDSSDIAFKIAGSLALQQAVKQADPILLEPIMKIEITTPEEYMGDIIGDLSSRRARILGTQRRGQLAIITALVPLAEIPGYATVLRSLSQGRVSYYMEPSHYDEVPRNITERLVEKEERKPKR